MSQLFGSSRDVIKSRYALITPNGFVPSAMPGLEELHHEHRDLIRTWSEANAASRHNGRKRARSRIDR